jgi:hypothetical protein
MGSEKILEKLRQFLLIISTGVFIMTITELSFLSHWSETIQYLPFALCALGLLTLFLAYFRPGRGTIKVMQGSMVVIAICSFVGFYEHMVNNLAFHMEIAPNTTTWELILATLEGANPVLAPGILTLGAVIGLAAIYKHPALETDKSS